MLIKEAANQGLRERERDATYMNKISKGKPTLLLTNNIRVPWNPNSPHLKDFPHPITPIFKFEESNMIC